jgi:hypothetical protein
MGETTMGRFARASEREILSDSGPRFRPRERRGAADRDGPDRRTPSEMKYFVLAMAALIGLGIGWLAGKAITSRLASPPVAAERAEPATAEPPSAGLASATPASDDEMADSQPAPDAVDSSDDASAPAVAAQAAPDHSQARAGRRVFRRAGMRRAARGNMFVRPFKALRKFRIW